MVIEHICICFEYKFSLTLRFDKKKIQSRKLKFLKTRKKKPIKSTAKMPVRKILKWFKFSKSSRNFRKKYHKILQVL